LNADLIRRVWERAADRCEYCQLPSDAKALGHLPCAYRLFQSQTPLP